MSSADSAIDFWTGSTLRNISVLILFHGLFPITYPIAYGQYVFNTWRYNGRPPLVRPGRRPRDYLDKLHVHPRQQRQAQRRVYNTDRGQLPVELVHVIVDMCRDDTSVLKSLSLVSRTWSSLARVHIFRDVNLSRHKAYNFIPILRSPLRTIYTIERLRIVDESRWDLVPFLVKEVARAGVVVHSLELNIQRLLKIKDRTKLTPMQPKRLLVRCDPWHEELINDAVGLACVFPDLECFSISATTALSGASFYSRRPYTKLPSGAQANLPSKLKHLTFTMHAPLRLAKWFLDSNIHLMGNLVSLEIFSHAYLENHRIDHDLELPDLFVCLEVLGPQLKHFGISADLEYTLMSGFLPWYTQDRKGAPLFPNLESIAFDQYSFWIINGGIVAILATLVRESSKFADVSFRCRFNMMLREWDVQSALEPVGLFWLVEPDEADAASMRDTAGTIDLLRKYRLARRSSDEFVRR